tara:strand:+ start:232 stop:615 length:384 start_codon:yes stop_codon:yes gene_type:complete
MAQTGNLNKQKIITSNIAVDNTSYVAGEFVQAALPQNITLSLIRIAGTLSVGPPTKITIQVSRDAAGDDIVIPSTEATFTTGITTAATGVVVYEVEANIYTKGTLYIHAKVDAATFTWTNTELYWRE